MAKSGISAGLILITADFAYDLLQAQMTGGKGAKLVDGFADFWSVLNGFPIGGDTVDMIAMFQESFEVKTLDGGVLEQLRLFDGQFVLNVTDETNKININDCAQGKCLESMLMLEALFSCPAEKAFLERKKLDPKELAYKIKDWIDKDTKADTFSFNNTNIRAGFCSCKGGR